MYGLGNKKKGFTKVLISFTNLAHHQQEVQATAQWVIGSKHALKGNTTRD
jgi:hypothetical protein